MKKTSILFSYFLLIFISVTIYAQSGKYEQISIQLKKADAIDSNAPLSTTDAINLTRLFMQQVGVQRCESDLKSRKFVLVFVQGTDIKSILSQGNVTNELLSAGYQIDAVADGNFALQEKASTENKSMPIANKEQSDPKATNKTAIAAKKLSKKAAKNASKRAEVLSSEPSEKNRLHIEAVEANSDKAVPQIKVAKDCNDCGEQKISDGLRDEVLKKADFGGDAMDFGSGDEEQNFDDSMPAEGSKLTEQQLDSLRQLINKGSDDDNPPNN